VQEAFLYPVFSIRRQVERSLVYAFKCRQKTDEEGRKPDNR
jgi:hypothetical protein